MKKCNGCKALLAISCFGKNKSKQDGRQPYCKDCGKARDKASYSRPERKKSVAEHRDRNKETNKEYVFDFLKKNPCVDCGETNPIFLDFDHVRGVKRKDISSALRRGWKLDTLIEEIQKCDVRCVKCHRVKTAKEGGWFDKYAEFF